MRLGLSMYGRVCVYLNVRAIVYACMHVCVYLSVSICVCVRLKISSFAACSVCGYEQRASINYPSVYSSRVRYVVTAV